MDRAVRTAQLQLHLAGAVTAGARAGVMEVLWLSAPAGLRNSATTPRGASRTDAPAATQIGSLYNVSIRGGPRAHGGRTDVEPGKSPGKEARPLRVVDIVECKPCLPASTHELGLHPMTARRHAARAKDHQSPQTVPMCRGSNNNRGGIVTPRIHSQLTYPGTRARDPLSGRVVP